MSANSGDRVQMKTPLVELDGDEMTRVLWSWIKAILIEPFVDLRSEYYDLGLPNREATGDQVTVQAAEAIERLGVGVKCATITPNAERVQEYGLSAMYQSPNGTIRAILDGTVFRRPIIAAGIKPYIPTWIKPITVARHAYGDIYKSVEMLISGTLGDAKVELVATAPGGSVSKRLLVHDFVDSLDPTGIVQGLHNTDSSISSFARSCFTFALESGQDLWFATKDTISKVYDRRFRDIFDELYEREYRKRFEDAGIAYYYMLIDDAVARVIRSEGGFVWALRNYDGDVMSDMVAAAFGSLAMMTSVLVSPKGCYEYEAAHGTVQRHYYNYRDGLKPSTNPVATIFAWTGALAKRGELDGLPRLVDFAKRLEAACLQTIASGVMTGDLYVISSLSQRQKTDSESFLHAVAKRL